MDNVQKPINSGLFYLSQTSYVYNYMATNGSEFQSVMRIQKTRG
jgi:hypothetical protein